MVIGKPELEQALVRAFAEDTTETVFAAAGIDYDAAQQVAARLAHDALMEWRERGEGDDDFGAILMNAHLVGAEIVLRVKAQT